MVAMVAAWVCSVARVWFTWSTTAVAWAVSFLDALRSAPRPVKVEPAQNTRPVQMASAINAIPIRFTAGSYAV